MKFTIACVSVLTCFGLCFGQDAARKGSGTAGPAAVATNADVSYCFARQRGLDPGHLPQSYLVARLRVLISYRNAGTRPIFLPLERERTISYGLKQGEMSVLKEPLSLFEPPFKPMKDLPADVSPDSPVTPKNDVFTVIPADGEITPPLLEEFTLPVTRPGVFKHYPNLRGHKVYIKLRFEHRELTAALKTDLSDRWARFGVLWTGAVTTNTFVIDVPADPQAAPCKEDPTPDHPAARIDHSK
jgi:hypothetical protein